MTASVKAISFWVFSTSKSEEQMYWIVTRKENFIIVLAQIITFLFLGPVEELIYHLPRLMNGIQ